MARWIKQSTSADVPIGPFVDPTDGFTAETALTLTQPDIRLKKNAGAWAQKNAAQTLSHEENGYYEVTLDATDTNTLGLLRLAVNESGALPIWEDFLVVPANVYDSLFSTDFLQVDATQLLGSAFAAPTVAGVIEADQTHYLGSAAPALVGGRFDSSVGAIAANAITATAINADAITAAKIADGAIDAATFAASAINDAAVSTDMDAYHGKVWVIKESTTTDHYAVVFFKNGQPVTSGITSPTIQVIKASDGTDLIASTALTEVGALGIYKKDEGTNKMVAGAIYFAKVQATIDSSTRSWLQQIGRDSA